VVVTGVRSDGQMLCVGERVVRRSDGMSGEIERLRSPNPASAAAMVVNLDGGGCVLDAPDRWRLETVEPDNGESVPSAPAWRGQRWEYRTEVVAGDCLYQVPSPHPDPPGWHWLDELGAEGWELVSVKEAPDGSWIGFFKRPQ